MFIKYLYKIKTDKGTSMEFCIFFKHHILRLYKKGYMLIIF